MVAAVKGCAGNRIICGIAVGADAKAAVNFPVVCGCTFTIAIEGTGKGCCARGNDIIVISLTHTVQIFFSKIINCRCGRCSSARSDTCLINGILIAGCICIKVVDAADAYCRHSFIYQLCSFRCLFAGLFSCCFTSFSSRLRCCIVFFCRCFRSWCFLLYSISCILNFFSFRFGCFLRYSVIRILHFFSCIFGHLSCLRSVRFNVCPFKFRYFLFLYLFGNSFRHLRCLVFFNNCFCLLLGKHRCCRHTYGHRSRQCSCQKAV